jgi:hypothetical protein
LKRNDYVITSDNRKVLIKEIYHTEVEGNEKNYPCLIKKKSIGSDYPLNDFLISRNHLIKYENKWICPKDNFPLYKLKDKINYYHIKLENFITDHLVINNGVVVESLGNYDHSFNEEYLIEQNKRYNNLYVPKKKKINIKSLN